MKQIIFLIGLVCFVGSSVYAQQDPMFSYYMYNTLAQNPAYAGSRDALTLTALHRSQWVGFEGAPVSQTFTAHTPLVNQHIGLGISLLNDRIGPVNTTSASVDYAFIFKTGEKSKLSLGLKGSAYYISSDISGLDLHQKGDVAFENGNVSRLYPNVGFGVYYSREKFYAGISAPRLMESNLKFANLNLANFSRHYFFIAGKVFTLSPAVDLKATTFVRATPGAPIVGDLTGQFVIRQLVVLGGGYRTGDAFSILAGLFITQQLYLGYAFDYSMTNKTLKYNAGSHEVMIRYDFIFKELKKVRSPRYF